MSYNDNSTIREQVEAWEAKHAKLKDDVVRAAIRFDEQVIASMGNPHRDRLHRQIVALMGHGHEHPQAEARPPGGTVWADDEPTKEA